MDVDCGSARDRLGRTLGGRYTLREILGAGGTAVVYRAETGDGENVAVKVLHDHLSRSDEVCRRFVREGQLGNVLEHPGTVRVLDHGATTDECPYLVLEYLEGESLEDRRVRLGGRLELYEVLDLCDKLLEVLEIAHAKGVVHRDVKPSNLFLTNDGVLKVLDFGIARVTDDTGTSTRTGQMVGTPAFMPPEQALSRPREVDARTDIWSVGATLFTLLSGEHVHLAETGSEHLVKAATLHARSLARALRGVPSNVEAFVARALAFNKNERWVSAASMRQELAFVRQDPGRNIGTTSAPPPDRTPSDPNQPTLVITTTTNEPASATSSISSAPGKKGDDRSGDLGMSVTSHPGGYDVFRKRSGWLVAIVALLGLLGIVGATMIVIVLARSPSPPPPPTTAREAPAEPTPESTPISATPLPPPTTETRAETGSPPPKAAAPAAAPPPPKRAATPVGAGAPRKDVYRPF